MINQLQVLKVLKDSHKVMTSKELEDIIHCQGRDIREAIHNLRATGDPDKACIASGDDGYQWVTQGEYLQHTVAQLKSRSRAILEAVWGIQRAISDNLYDPIKEDLDPNWLDKALDTPVVPIISNPDLLDNALG